MQNRLLRNGRTGWMNGKQSFGESCPLTLNKHKASWNRSRPDKRKVVWVDFEIHPPRMLRCRRRTAVNTHISPMASLVSFWICRWPGHQKWMPLLPPRRLSLPQEGNYYLLESGYISVPQQKCLLHKTYPCSLILIIIWIDLYLIIWYLNRFSEVFLHICFPPAVALHPRICNLCSSTHDTMFPGVCATHINGSLVMRISVQ